MTAYSPDVFTFPGMVFECKEWIDEEGDPAGDCTIQPAGGAMDDMGGDDSDDDRRGKRGGKGKRGGRGNRMGREGDMVTIEMADGSTIIMISAATKLIATAATFITAAMALY